MIPYFQVTKFTVGPITLQSWGTFVALGFIVGIAVAYFAAKRRGPIANQILDVNIWIIILAFLGARLTYVVGHLDFYLESPLSALKIWEGGLTIYGGFIGALLAFFIYVRRKKISFWDLAEPLMFALPLGIFVGRIGCFLIHDHMGKITNVPWGMEYLDGTIRHETSLYNGLSALLLFITFLILKRFSGSNKKGFFITLFMLWYGVSRFITDFFRADDLIVVDHRWFGLTASQYLSVILFITGLYLSPHLFRISRSLLRG